jgi:hypothetical protein
MVDVFCRAKAGADVRSVAAVWVSLAVKHIGTRAEDGCGFGVAASDNGCACSCTSAKQALFKRCVSTGRQPTERDTGDRCNFKKSHLLLPP